MSYKGEGTGAAFQLVAELGHGSRVSESRAPVSPPHSEASSEDQVRSPPMTRPSDFQSTMSVGPLSPRFLHFLGEHHDAADALTAAPARNSSLVRFRNSLWHGLNCVYRKFTFFEVLSSRTSDHDYV